MSAMAVFEERQDAANGEPLESDLRRKPLFYTRTKIALGTCVALSLLLVALVVYTSLPSEPAKFGCTRGSWHSSDHPRSLTAHHGGLCYDIINRNVTLDEARMHCTILRNGKLVAIRSYKEEEFLEKLLVNTTCTPWLDFSYIPREHVLKWADGTPVNYNAIAPYSSHAAPTPTSCFHFDSNLRYTWRPTPCSARHCAVCVSPLVPLSYKQALSLSL